MSTATYFEPRSQGDAETTRNEEDSIASKEDADPSRTASTSENERNALSQSGQPITSEDEFEYFARTVLEQIKTAQVLARRKEQNVEEYSGLLTTMFMSTFTLPPFLAHMEAGVAEMGMQVLIQTHLTVVTDFSGVERNHGLFLFF